MGRSKEKHRGIGVYSYEQTRYSTPFGLFVVVVIGFAFGLRGAVGLGMVLAAREMESLKFGRADPHVWGFVYSISTIICGVFLAHAGVIFWMRRLTAFLRSRRIEKQRTTHPSHER